MKVLTVLNWLNRGGIEVQLYDALPLLRERGIEMDVCCTGPPGSLDAEFIAHGSKVMRLPKKANCYATARLFDEVLAEGRYDAVHSHLAYTSGGFCLSAWRQGLPIAVSFHNAVSTALYGLRATPVLRHARAAWLAWHKRLMNRYARIFVGHSEVNIESYAPRWRQDPGRYRVIMNGIAWPRQLPTREAARQALEIDSDRTVLLHVGAFKEQKNHDGLLEIFSRVTRQHRQAELILVGDGTLRPGVERQASHLGLSSRVRFAGVQRDIWKYYAAADAFVFPSTMEGFGNVLAEAQSAELPIVASNIPAHRESVAPAQHRFLFPLPDYRCAAEMVLEQLDASAARNNPWVPQSDHFVRERFSVQQFSESLARLYYDLAA